MESTLDRSKTGRAKGVPNKVTATAKENLLAVFTRLGGTAGMADWARENPTEFYKLYGKLIPAESRITGAEGGPVELIWPLSPNKLDQP